MIALYIEIAFQLELNIHLDDVLAVSLNGRCDVYGWGCGVSGQLGCGLVPYRESSQKYLIPTPPC